MSDTLSQNAWWTYIDHDLQELLKQSMFLIELIEERGSTDSRKSPEFHDYSFVVFPAAKAYEGFLKKLFLDLDFITDKAYFGKRFRIGKALNPNLSEKLRKYSVYVKLADFCQGSDLPDVLWDTWVKGRNRLFHWFPNERNAIEFSEAKEIISEIVRAMDKAFEECKIKQ